MNIITTQQGLDQLVMDILNKTPKTLGLDTEFYRRDTYYSKLCLIQIALSEKEIYLIDPLTNSLDLYPFSRILLNKDITIIMHSCEQDLEIFLHLFHQLPHKVIDTQLLAMYCGYGGQISYKKIVETIVAIELDKGQQDTDWSKRPLNNEQINYACEDVRYLFKLYQILHLELVQNERLSWLEEDIKTFFVPTKFQANLEVLCKKIKITHKYPFGTSIKKALVAFREDYAQRVNKPRQHIFHDKVIRVLCTKNIFKLTEQEIKSIFYKAKERMYHPSLVQDIKKVLDRLCVELGQDTFDREPRRAVNAVLLEKIRALKEEKAAELNLPPHLLMTQEECEILASMGDLSHLDHIKVFSGWRYEVLGKHIKEITPETHTPAL